MGGTQSRLAESGLVVTLAAQHVSARPAPRGLPNTRSVRGDIIAGLGVGTVDAVSASRPALRAGLRRALGGVVVAAVALLAACGGGPDILSPGERDGAAGRESDNGDAAADPTGTPGVDTSAGPGESTSPEPTVAPTLSELTVTVDDVRATVGQPVAVTVDVDTAGTVAVTSTELVGEPAGVSEDGTWTPETAGTWDATLRVIDDLGRTSDHPIRFISRYPASPDTLVGIGDSIASGHGLQVSDYLGRDPCFRSDDGYPHLVTSGLIERGIFGAGGRTYVVACSGAGVDEVSSALVSGGSPNWAPSGVDALTQLDWVIRANPAVVTVTVGINDIGFVEPADLIVGARLDDAVFDARVAAMADGLDALVDRIVDTTDATVVVTGYYNPAAARPQGVEGCRLDCFRALTDEAVDRLDAAIADALPDDPRVRFVTLSDSFADHGAPNGLGLDSARAGDGVLGELFGGPFVGTQSYCARGDTVGESWVNALDCVHPDDEGHRQIAAAVLGAL